MVNIPYLQGFIHPKGGCLGFLPSTVLWVAISVFVVFFLFAHLLFFGKFLYIFVETRLVPFIWSKSKFCGSFASRNVLYFHSFSLSIGCLKQRFRTAWAVKQELYSAWGWIPPWKFTGWTQKVTKIEKECHFFEKPPLGGGFQYFLCSPLFAEKEDYLFD